MQDYETLLADLQAQKSQIELERGRQVTKQQILAFVAELIKGEPTDKEYQRKIIDNLVFMVYVYDNEIVTYLNFGVDKAIERVRLDETNAAIEGLKNVQTLSPLLHHNRGIRTRSGVRISFIPHHRQQKNPPRQKPRRVLLFGSRRHSLGRSPTAHVCARATPYSRARPLYLETFVLAR